MPQGTRNEGLLERVDAIALFAHVAHSNRVALATLDRTRERHAAEASLDNLLHLSDRDPVARNGLSIDDQFEVGLADDAVSKHRFGANRRHLLERGLETRARLLDGLEIRATYLQA